MGLTSLKATIINPKDASKLADVKFLVDSGAIYSVVDKQVLNRIGVKPFSEKEFFLANGQAVKRKLGGLVYEYSGEKGYAPVIFGEAGDSNLMGAVTLEALGLMLDPLQRRLLHMPMVLGKINLTRKTK